MQRFNTLHVFRKKLNMKNDMIKTSGNQITTKLHSKIVLYFKLLNFTPKIEYFKIPFLVSFFFLFASIEYSDINKLILPR